MTDEFDYERIDIDYENITEEEADRLLRAAGYEPKLVGKFYELIGEHALLKIKFELQGEALDGLLDGLDANTDLRCGLSDRQWKQRIKEARRVSNER